MEVHKKKTCPYCRTVVTSKAVNHSLQQIITQFVEKKKVLESGGELPASKRPAAVPTAAMVQPDGGAEKLASEYRAKAMRIEVLENEKADAVAMAAAAEDKADAAQKVLDHLAATEQEALEKMARLQRELDLVKQHAAMQQTKRDEARREHDAAQAQCDLLDRTLEPLVQECDKIALLYEHQALSLIHI